MFTIERIQGGGAFATVVVARAADGTRRALKVLDGHRCSDPTSIGRFRDEARMLQQIRHPSIVHAHALHRYGERLVLELDFVDGASLTEVLGPPPHRLELPETLAIAETVARALWSAWDDPWGDDDQPMRIVHRDVHPANLMLDRDGRVWVLDFGVAKGSFAGREAMSLYDLGGAIGYLAPERKQGLDGPPVDVYALAALVVHMSGERLLLPQREARHDEVARSVLERLEVPDAAADLPDLLGRMLAWAPEERPNMGEVANALATLRDALPASDLAALARARVVPYLEARPERDPHFHPRYEDVAFLQTRSPDAPVGPLTLSQARQRLKTLLAEPDWPRRLDEVKRVSRASDPWAETPLLDVLARVEAAWWRPLARKTTAEEAEAALLILGERPTQATLDAARKLARHAEPRIAHAARFVLRRQG